MPAAAVAGRTNYDQWDKVTRTLLEETDQAEQDERAANEAALGLDGKYAFSQAEQDERTKAAQLQQTKEKLDRLQERQDSLVQVFEGAEIIPSDAPAVWRLTRESMDAYKRVVTIRNVRGQSPVHSKLVLTQDLSLIESKLNTSTPTSPNNRKATPKSYPDDAENNVVETPLPRTIHGLIKLTLENVEDCTIHVKCKFITGTIEFHHCKNIHVVCDPTAFVTTVQADLSRKVRLEFRDPSTLPKIYHAGVSDMTVVLEQDGIVASQIDTDYQTDGAAAVGAATKEEFRFVTQLLGGQWVNERVAQAGTTALTERELQLEQERRERASKMAMAMAEDMIQIKDKDGNVLVTKHNNTHDDDGTTDTQENTNTGIDTQKIVLQECESLKAQGNEAFQAGEYGQAILQYSLALDKATQLHHDNESNKVFPRDIVFANRAACFLKLGQHEKAQQDSREALQINPDNLKAQFRLGLSLHATRQYQAALPVLAAAHKRQPKNKQIKQALQFCEVRLQQEHRKRMMGE